MKIAIAGYGVEGRENYNYWSARPDTTVTIVDETVPSSYPHGAQTMFGPGVFSRLSGFDMVVRTAGLAPRKIKTDGKVWSGTNEFFANCPAPIIGVTGSKGKGTTASLIAAILQKAGKKVWLVGNIGVPALSVLPDVESDHIVVYELSSFQLWDLQQSPQTAVVLFIEQEHLDVHASMEEYIEAKAQIARHQTVDDRLVYNAQNRYATEITQGSAAQKIGYPAQETAHVTDGNFYYGDQLICPVSSLAIRGEHNQQNAIAAIDAVWHYMQDIHAISEALATFTGLPHRLSYVDTVKGVEYYDDSIATTPTSAIAALRAFPDKKKVIILGGSYKGSDFSELAEELKHHDVRVLLIGEEAGRISEALEAAKFEAYEIIENATAEQFTYRAYELAEPGSVVLLSPAAASFGMFKNYIDRGEQFIAAVNALPRQ